ncbi:MaoC/PaaZ C-terminal domain-containing protein [Microvirga sp. VF16]|uniref:MaoC/PaaZ C-terminal domain-containing protein n=1 Tax=Microvirga sp. VF16 TaxID=2807101 RepID=UPI00193D7C8A|nr:MaoC/PaaZ C-terminal domain-containing protein [Microvirga sp. VF16]QRM32978.1 hypothetical protein JO965_26995 [Microvirga sp. VF16]
MGNALHVRRASELSHYLHQPLGPTRWCQVDQERIDAFAALTDDPQWIHVDPHRAAEELPGGRTIVPGHLLLALLPSLVRETYLVTKARSSRLAALRNVRFRRAIGCDVPFRLSGCIQSVKTRGVITFVEMRCMLTVEHEDTVVEVSRTDAFQD